MVVGASLYINMCFIKSYLFRSVIIHTIPLFLSFSTTISHVFASGTLAVFLALSSRERIKDVLDK